MQSRIIAVVFGLVVFGLVGWGVYKTGYLRGEQAGEYQANSDTYASHAQKEIRRNCSWRDGVAFSACVIGVVEATNEHERSESNLVAQRDMARWAFAMLIVTVLMALVTALGVYYVWRTLLATQRMANDTRVIGEAQTRAHVLFNVESFEFEVVDFSGPETVTTGLFNAEIRNFGNTVAAHVTAWAKATLTIDGIKRDPVYFHFAKDGFIQNGDGIRFRKEDRFIDGLNGIPVAVLRDAQAVSSTFETFNRFTDVFGNVFETTGIYDVSEPRINRGAPESGESLLEANFLLTPLSETTKKVKSGNRYE